MPSATRATSNGEAGDELDQGLLPDLLGRQLRVAFLSIFRPLEHRLALLGLTPQQFGLLVLVERNPGTRQSRLAQARGLDKSTLVPMIDRLERDGILERRPAPDDRRSKTIWITERGTERLRAAIPEVQRHNADVANALTESELHELVRLLEKVTHSLEGQEPE